jgi:hypothetical protein
VFAALDQRPDGTGDMVAVKRFPRGSPLAVETWTQEQRIHGLLRHGSVPRLLGEVRDEIAAAWPSTPASD